MQPDLPEDPQETKTSTKPTVEQKHEEPMSKPVTFECGLSRLGMGGKLRSLGEDRLQELMPYVDGEPLTLVAKEKLSKLGVYFDPADGTQDRRILDDIKAYYRGGHENRAKRRAQREQQEPVEGAWQVVGNALRSLVGRQQEARGSYRIWSQSRVASHRPPDDVRVTKGFKCPAIPKDLSARPKVMYMAATSADDAGLEVGLRLIKDMDVIAQREGFTVVAMVEKRDRAALTKAKFGGKVVQIDLKQQAKLTCWVEDSGEIGHRIQGPAVIDGKTASAFMEADRKRRGYRVTDPAATPKVAGSVGHVGVAVAQDRKQAEKEALAVALEREYRASQSHLEGGNLLVGTDTSGALFALVGRDGVAVTMARFAGKLPSEMISKELAQCEEEVRAAIAGDLGLPPERVVFVEQPGRFHLDMGILLLGDGIVAVNDSLQVLDLLKGWIAEYESALLAQGIESQAVRLAMGDLRKQVELDLRERARLERATVQDLERAGLPLAVKRVPGAFPETGITEPMNFLNGEIGTSPSGNGYLVSNGGSDPRAEQAAAAAYLRLQPALGTIYFLNPTDCAASLRKGGGIGCRTKSSIG